MDEQFVMAKVFRFDPKENEKQRYDLYKVPYMKGMRINQVLKYIYENYDGSLSFRESCLVGLCGVCLVLVNGKTVLACKELAREEMTIEPMPNFTIIRDLVVDFGKPERQKSSTLP